MTDQEARIKMAEMCGYSVYVAGFLEMWKPNKDIEQAFEVLEALPETYTIKKLDHKYYQCDIWINSEVTHGKTIHEAIFNSVKLYLSESEI